MKRTRKKMPLEQALKLIKHPLMPVYGYITDKKGYVMKVILDLSPTQWKRNLKKMDQYLK